MTDKSASSSTIKKPNLSDDRHRIAEGQLSLREVNRIVRRAKPSSDKISRSTSPSTQPQQPSAAPTSSSRLARTPSFNKNSGYITTRKGKDNGKPPSNGTKPKKERSEAEIRADLIIALDKAAQDPEKFTFLPILELPEEGKHCNYTFKEGRNRMQCIGTESRELKSPYCKGHTEIFLKRVVMEPKDREADSKRAITMDGKYTL